MLNFAIILHLLNFSETMPRNFAVSCRNCIFHRITLCFFIKCYNSVIIIYFRILCVGLLTLETLVFFLFYRVVNNQIFTVVPFSWLIECFFYYIQGILNIKNENLLKNSIKLPKFLICPNVFKSLLRFYSIEAIEVIVFFFHA